MLRSLLKRREPEIDSDQDQIYHARLFTKDPNITLTLCNQKSSHGWLKYNLDNFARGKIFSIKEGKEIKIKGRRCRKCLISSGQI
jgi:hypothetical protein